MTHNDAFFVPGVSVVGVVPGAISGSLHLPLGNGILFGDGTLGKKYKRR